MERKKYEITAHHFKSIAIDRCVGTDCSRLRTARCERHFRREWNVIKLFQRRRHGILGKLGRTGQPGLFRQFERRIHLAVRRCGGVGSSESPRLGGAHFLAAVLLLSSIAFCPRAGAAPARGNHVDGAAPAATGKGAEAGDSLGESIADSMITTRVKAALLAHAGAAGSDISVATRGGRVVLSGAMPERKQITQAERIARAVKGVKSVDNNITLRK